MENTYIEFILNGKHVSCKAENSKTTLLKFLRNVSCLKGSKLGCGTGHCGACTVIVNGRAVRSCVLPLIRVAGKDVTTIEGLQGEDGALHPIQQAFLDVGAVQCGFCTPGMVIATKVLLDKCPCPSRAEIRKALSHNYCRCTGYTKIIKGVELATVRMHPEFADEIQKREELEETSVVRAGKDKYIVIGTHHQDVDGNLKVTGKLEFADDLAEENTLIGRPLFAGVPCAKIKNVDVSEALELPGVVAIYGPEDLPGHNGYGMVNNDHRVFAETEVNFAYDVLALVVAKTEEIARTAVNTIKVELELQNGIFSIKDGKENLREINYTQGDIESVKEEENLLVFKEHFETALVEHAYLEPESTTAYIENGQVVVKTPTQAPFDLRKQIAGVLALNPEQVRIIVTPLGGGFGGKGDATIQPMAAMASYLTKKPVKITLSREESLGLSTKKHPYFLDYEVGFTQNGILEYVDAEIASDGGPYSELSPRVIDQSCIFAIGPYRIKAGRTYGRCVKTNNLLSSAMRGFGINQVSFAMETIIDMAAEKLGLSPFEIRRRNAFIAGDNTFSGEILFSSVGIKDTIDVCEKKLKEVLAKYKDYKPEEGKVLGVGMASCFKNVGAGKGRVDNAGVTINRSSDGIYNVWVSGVDMGQGFRTCMLQLLCETLKISEDKVVLYNGDTETTALHGSAVGERQTLISGMAVVKACQEFLTKDIDGKSPLSVKIKYEGPRTFSLGDTEGRKEVPPALYKNYPAYAYATHAVIIEVDKNTGDVDVLEVVAVHDCGRALNPTILQGQIEGCCSMGIGYALSEHFDLVNGMPVTRNYGALGVPEINKTPVYHIVLIEDPEPGGPYGAKGISEIGTIPITTAITNAIYNAVGYRVFSLPVKKEEIVKAVEVRV